jgi:hypothetical protein
VGGQAGFGVYLVHNASSRNYALNLGNEDEAYFIQAYFGPMTGIGSGRVADIDADKYAPPPSIVPATLLRSISGMVVDPNLNVPFKQWLKQIRNESNSQASLAILKAIYVANFANTDITDDFADGSLTADGSYLDGLSAMDIEIQRLQRSLDLANLNQLNQAFEFETFDTTAQNVPNNESARPVVTLALALAEDDLDAEVFAPNPKLKTQ